ncbi:MAG TPA: type II toxin-antitoxin system HicB family antitoxin [Chloroflexota bacterium]
MEQTYLIPPRLEPKPEGGYLVTSSALPELITEGDTIEEALANARDAVAVVLEIYAGKERTLPPDLIEDMSRGPIYTEQLVTA